MMYCDDTSGILKWASEEFCIPYISPVDGRFHRYFPDFYLETQMKRFVIEIKPKAQTQLPEKPAGKTKRFMKRYLTECATFAVNQAKWQAAREYCEQRQWSFLVFTEQELFARFK